MMIIPDDDEQTRNKKIAEKAGIANIFIGAYKDDKYIPAEYDLSTKDTKHWMADLLLGRPHDHEFYKKLEFSPSKIKNSIMKRKELNNSYQRKCF